MKPFHLYILRCADGAYYVGHTDDLELRVAQHQAGEVPGYTSERRPVTLVYACDFPTRDEALSRERQVKGWSRAKKEALIREAFGELPTLARTARARASTSSARADSAAEPAQDQADLGQARSAHPEPVEG